MKDLYCDSCGALVIRCDDEAIKVVCSTCVMEDINKEFPLQLVNKVKSDKPRGWHLRKQYVHIDGTVYEFGVEKPELEGKFKPTKIKIKEEKKKATNKEIEFTRVDIVSDIKKLKKKLKTETNPKRLNQINRKINKKQIELSKLK